VLSLVAIAIGMSDAGLTGLGVREYAARDGSDRDGYMRNLLGMRLVFTGFGALAATVFAAGAGYGAAMVAGTALAGAAYLLLMIQSSLSIPLQVRLRLGWIATLQFLAQFLAAIIVAALVLAGAGFVAFLAAPIPVMLALLAITVVLVRGQIPFRPRFSAGEWRSMLADVLVFAVILALGVVYYRVITIFLSLFSTEQQTGYYGAAFRIVETLSAVPSLLAGSAFPLLSRAARDDRKRLGYALDRLTRGMMLVGIWVAISVVLGAPIAIEIVAGDTFMPSIEILQYLGVALAATFVLSAWSLGLLAAREHKAMMIANGVAAGVALVAGATLVTLDGARGGAIALLASEFTLAIGYGIAIARHSELVPLDISLVARVAIAAAAALVLPWALDLPALADVSLGTAVYWIVLVALRAIPEEITMAFRSRLHGRVGRAGA
jgi:O-antigen/teichoic acid export membrane protein